MQALEDNANLHELRSRADSRNLDSRNLESTEPLTSLPQVLKPVDRGRDAWTVLIAGFVFEAIFWGKLLLQHGTVL